ncbi:MAG: GNAT family protein [Bacteroidales bacterium]|jgi:RimJ/RimL family protein N-acetyltransferase|nr:GNAT family protein [Bacteroidales bacterium]
MIRLEEFTNKDFERFIGWIDNENFMYQFAGSIFSFPITEDQLIEYVSDNNRKIYKVINQITDKVIGHGEINRIDKRNRNARLCRILIADKNDRNKGFGEMIINELLQMGFKELKLHRIDLGVFEFNKSAIKCYEKCGFTIEGLLRESFVIDNKFLSAYNMSLLRREWDLMQPIV